MQDGAFVLLPSALGVVVGYSDTAGTDVALVLTAMLQLGSAAAAAVLSRTWLAPTPITHSSPKGGPCIVV